MRKIFKHSVAIFLALIMLIGVVPIMASAEDATHQTGDLIQFGYYPQSKVRDQSTIDRLDAMTKKWVSYDYYSGTGNREDCNMVPSDFMQYADINDHGIKYRAVKFTKYRPKFTGGFAGTSEDNSFQDDGAYYINRVNYFKYEPLYWKVLDASTGLVVCDTIIDSQPYKNFICEIDGQIYGEKAKTIFASNWEHSSLREWLNDDFFNTAFITTAMKNSIQTLTRENESTISGKLFACNPTTDKITLLTYWDVSNSDYGFDSNESRQKKYTDYAVCQGFDTSASGSSWWLRTSGFSSRAAIVASNGVRDDYNGRVDETYRGVVPAMNLVSLDKFSRMSVSVEGAKLDYKGSKTLAPEITTIDNSSYTVSYSSDSPSVTVDENGKVYGAKTGSANITVTVTDQKGHSVSDTCKVDVEYTWWQWIIRIVLFGWIWY